MTTEQPDQDDIAAAAATAPRRAAAWACCIAVALLVAGFPAPGKAQDSVVVTDTLGVIGDDEHDDDHDGDDDSNDDDDDEDNDRQRLSVRRLDDLHFGRVIADRAGRGAVTIDAASGRRAVSGGAIDIGGNYSPAAFEIRGAPGAPFVILLPRAIAITGPATADVADFVSHPTGQGRLGPNGRAIVRVGATLQLQAGQAAGNYSGAFDIVVTYQAPDM